MSELIKGDFVWWILGSSLGQAAEAETRSKDLEKSIAEHQSLLKEASHRYGALEDEYEKDKEGNNDM
jgi:hypothetical protein